MASVRDKYSKYRSNNGHVKVKKEKRKKNGLSVSA